MTATREPAPPEAGEWAIISAASYRKTPHALGGPYSVAQLKKRGVGGWTVAPQADNTTFVGDKRIKRVYLTRGEALLALRDIDNAITAYEDERTGLLPRYQARIAGILSI